MTLSFSQRLWLFATLRATGIGQRELAAEMTKLLVRRVDPKLIDRVLDGESVLTGQALLAASIVTSCPLQPNVFVGRAAA